MKTNAIGNPDSPFHRLVNMKTAGNPDEAAHTLASLNMSGLREDRCRTSRREPGMTVPFFADIVTDSDLIAHVRGDSYAEAEARRTFIVRACNAHDSLVQENARAHESYEGMNHAYQQLSDDHAKLLGSHAALVAALKRAESHLRFLASAMPGELAAAALCGEVADQARAALALAKGAQ